MKKHRCQRLILVVAAVALCGCDPEAGGVLSPGDQSKTELAPVQGGAAAHVQLSTTGVPIVDLAKANSTGDLNHRGDAVGRTSPEPGITSAALWDHRGRLMDLGSLGGMEATALGVNQRRTVVGASTLPDGLTRAFRWTPQTGMEELPWPGGSSAAWDVNDEGWIVGSGRDAGGTFHPLFWRDEEVVRLGSLGGGGSALGINREGDVVGYSRVASGSPHAFIWNDPEGMRDLGTLGGPSSLAWAIDDDGRVVGSSQIVSGETRAFLWTAADGMRDLGTLGDFSRALDVDTNGFVVGDTRLPSGEIRGFLWTEEDGMRNLGTLNPDDTFAGAGSINRRGEILGLVILASGDRRAVIWKP